MCLSFASGNIYDAADGDALHITDAAADLDATECCALCPGFCWSKVWCCNREQHTSAALNAAECWTLSWQSMMLQRRAGQVTQVYFLTRSGGLHQQQHQLNALMKAFPSFLSAKTAVSMQFSNFVVGREDITWVINFFYGSLLYSIEIDLILWLLKSHILTPLSARTSKLTRINWNYSAGEITMMLMIKRCVDQYGCNLWHQVVYMLFW